MHDDTLQEYHSKAGGQEASEGEQEKEPHEHPAPGGHFMHIGALQKKNNPGSSHQHEQPQADKLKKLPANIHDPHHKSIKQTNNVHKTKPGV